MKLTLIKGFAISVVPIYLSEISSHKIRGEIGTVNEVCFKKIKNYLDDSKRFN